MVTPRIFRVWQVSGIFDFLMNFFFQEIQRKILDLEIQLIFSCPLGVAYKNKSTDK